MGDHIYPTRGCGPRLLLTISPPSTLVFLNGPQPTRGSLCLSVRQRSDLEFSLPSPQWQKSRTPGMSARFHHGSRVPGGGVEPPCARGASRSERGVSAIPPPRHGQPASFPRGCVSSVRRESNPQRPLWSSSTSSWRVCRSTTDRWCGAEGSNLSPCGPRIYSPPAGTTCFHTARCRARVLRVNSEGATATGVGGSGTWCLVPTRRPGPD